MIFVEGLSKTFGDHTVLRSISFTIDKGDVIAVIGPSGSGKTTLLRCMNFLEKAEEGTITFDNRTYNFSDIRKSEMALLRKKTGFVFQEYNLFLNKTALMNVMSGLIYARHVDKNTARIRAMEALKKVGLSGYEDFYPHELSGGQKQRVAIARAIVTDPEVIYFDEPTSALDPELTKEVLTVMRSLAEEGRTMVVVTHEMNFARNVANRILFMENSVIVEEGFSKDFFNAPKTKRAEEFIQGINS